MLRFAKVLKEVMNIERARGDHAALGAAREPWMEQTTQSPKRLIAGLSLLRDKHRSCCVPRQKKARGLVGSKGRLLQDCFSSILSKRRRSGGVALAERLYKARLPALRSCLIILLEVCLVP